MYKCSNTIIIDDPLPPRTTIPCFLSLRAPRLVAAVGFACIFPLVDRPPAATAGRTTFSSHRRSAIPDPASLPAPAQYAIVPIQIVMTNSRHFAVPRGHQRASAAKFARRSTRLCARQRNLAVASQGHIPMCPSIALRGANSSRFPARLALPWAHRNPPKGTSHSPPTQVSEPATLASARELRGTSLPQNVVFLDKYSNFTSPSSLSIFSNTSSAVRAASHQSKIRNLHVVAKLKSRNSPALIHL